MAVVDVRGHDLIQVNSETNPITSTWNIYDKRVLTLGNGGWVVIWEEHIGWDYNLYQRVFDHLGNPVGTETKVSTDSYGSLGYPILFGTSGDGWGITWKNNYLIHHQTFGANGSPVSAGSQDTGINTGIAATFTIPLTGGGWVHAWEGYDGSDRGVVQQRYSAGGSALWPDPELVNDHTNGYQGPVGGLSLSNGGWVVVWRSLPQDGLYQSIYSSNGDPIAVEQLVASEAGSDARVWGLNSGGWLVTWLGDDGSGDGVFQRAFSQSGNPLGPAVRVNQHATADQQFPKVASLADGGWVVVWESEDQDGSSWGVYQRVYNADGTARGGESRVNTHVDLSQEGPSVVGLEDGGWVVAWTSWWQDDLQQSLRMQAFDSAGQRVGSELNVSGNTQTARFSELMALEGGKWLAVWRDSANIVSRQFEINNAPAQVGTIPKIEFDAKAPASYSLKPYFEDEENDALEFSLAPDAPNWVTLGNASGELSVNPPARFGGSVTLKILVSDGQLLATAVLEIAVTTSNAPPTGISLSKASIAENLKAGTVVGMLSVTDPDGTAATYKLASNPGGFFKIDGDKLQLAKPLDFEKARSHAVTIEATDPGGLNATKDFAIAVTDVIDVITGTNGKNMLIGARGADDIRGRGGADKLFGLGGKDTLDGGKGRDTLVGGPGADRLIGGKGRDTASYEDAGKGVTASLKKPAGNKGDAKGDSYSSIENLTGSDRNDRLAGDNRANVLDGRGGNDKLSGGKGSDLLEGGAGKDVLTGGRGADAFVFRSVSESPAKKKGWDVISDFKPKQGDRIDLGDVDARTGKKNQAFKFIGEKDFSGRKGELRFEKSDGKTFVYGDVNGDGKADFIIEFGKAIDLKKADFVL